MENNNYICTVLLISYNHEKYIRKAIDSIMEQKTRWSFKVHIFDDCSTDSTSEIVLEYAKQYPDIIFPYIAEYNQGAQSNIWNAFLSVDTKYFILLEGDDYWCNESKLEMQINALENHSECSFCGHDTYLICLDESSREYDDGSRCCTQEFLRHKNIFSYKDFRHVSDGGYIPYVSARLIRTEVLQLDKIMYKESVLFDFTQFYYLLLQGDYYYIDLPMSVYQRTGSGVCSGTTPMDFLNTFIQNAIDFNKQTNNIIADKIYSDCLLQIDFRLKLYKNNFIKIPFKKFLTQKTQNEFNPVSLATNQVIIMENSLSPNKYYYLCNGGLGFTALVCSYKDSIEKQLKGKVHFFIQDKHEFIFKMYSIQEYTIVDMQGADIESISSRTPIPEPGKIYVVHPFSHREHTKFYIPLHGLFSTIKYGEWIAEFLGMDSTAKMLGPSIYPNLKDELRQKIERIAPIEKIVLFIPEAHSLEQISEKVWEKKAFELKKEGFSIISCVENKNNIVIGTRYLSLTPEEIVSISMCCHEVYSLRNGICDLLYEQGSSLHVYYPSHATHFIYSVNSLFNRKDIMEEIVLESSAVHRKEPIMPMIFGIIKAPNCMYQYYVNHKDRFKSIKRIIKRIVKWK